MNLRQLFKKQTALKDIPDGRKFAVKVELAEGVLCTAFYHRSRKEGPKVSCILFDVQVSKGGLIIGAWQVQNVAFLDERTPVVKV